MADMQWFFLIAFLAILGQIGWAVRQINLSHTIAIASCWQRSTVSRALSEQGSLARNSRPEPVGGSARGGAADVNRALRRSTVDLGDG
jgi:hypothetical protein